MIRGLEIPQVPAPALGGETGVPRRDVGIVLEPDLPFRSADVDLSVPKRKSPPFATVFHDDDQPRPSHRPGPWFGPGPRVWRWWRWLRHGLGPQGRQRAG